MSADQIYLSTAKKYLIVVHVFLLKYYNNDKYSITYLCF